MKRPRMLNLLPTRSLRNSLRSKCASTILMTLVAVAMIVPMPVMAEIFVGAAAAPAPNQYNYVINATDLSVRIGPGSGTLLNNHILAGGTVSTPQPPVGNTVFTWNGILTVNSGNRFGPPPGEIFDNGAYDSQLLLSNNFTIANGGGIVVGTGVRPGFTTPVPSVLRIDLGNRYTLSLNGASISVSGGSRVDIGIGQAGGSFSVQNSAINVGFGGVVNLLASEFRIVGNNFGSGRINVGAIVERDLFNNSVIQFVNGDTLIQTPAITNGGVVNNSLGNNLYLFSGVTNLQGGTGTQRVDVGTGATLTLSGNIYADVTEALIATSSDVIKVGGGTLALTGGLFERSLLLDIQGGTVAFTTAANLGGGDIRLNGTSTVLDFRGGFAPIDNDITMVGTGPARGGTIGVLWMGSTLTTTGDIDAGDGTFQKTGLGTLDIQGLTTRSGTLDIQAGSVRVGDPAGLTARDNLGGGLVQLNGEATSLIYAGMGTRDNPDTLVNNFNLRGGGTIAVEGAATLRLTGTITGNGVLFKKETGTLFLDGTIGNNIDLEIAAGMVRFTSPAHLVQRNITFRGVDTVLEYSGAGVATLGTTLILGGDNSAPPIGGGQIMVSEPTGKLTLTRSIINGSSGAGSLWKTGEGTLTLNNQSAFTGEMYIEKGTVEVLRQDSLRNASKLRMESGTTFDMTANYAHQTLRGIDGDVGAKILMKNNTLTLNLHGEHSFLGDITGNAGTSSIVITAYDFHYRDTNGDPQITPAKLTLDLGKFHGNMRFKSGTLPDVNGNLNSTLFVVGSDQWTPGAGNVLSTLTFDLTPGAMPFGANPSQYRDRSNPFGINVDAGGVDFETTLFRVWVDAQVENNKYHVGHIKSVGPIDNPPNNQDNVRKTLFQNTTVIPDEAARTVDIYTQFTGFSGLNTRLQDFGYTGLTENQNQVANNIDKFRVISATKGHGMLNVITAVINAEDASNDQNATVRDLKNLLTQLGGDVHANAMFITQNRPWQFAYQRLTLDSEMYFRGGEAVSRGETLRGQSVRGQSVRGQSVSLARMNRLWVSPTYSGSSMTGDGNARGGTIDRVGFQMGFDRRIRHNATAGALIGYNSSCLKQVSDRVQVGDVQLGGYFSGMFGYYIELRGFAGFGFQSYESTRVIDNLGWLGYNSRMSAAGRTSGWSSFANVEVARPLFFGVLILRPTVAFDSEYAARDAFSETGDEIALRVGRTTAGRFALRGGFSMETGTMRRVSVTARVFGGGQFGGDDVRVNTQFVGIGAYPVQNIRAVKTGWGFLEGGIGTRLYVNNTRTMAFHADYDGLGSKNMSNHAISCGFSWMY